ncbi:MAG: hypothetical protein EOL89_00020 [Actinobacteria bacterium]|nr:hypothetical protein [Actinomycetota bacterium]
MTNVLLSGPLAEAVASRLVTAGGFTARVSNEPSDAEIRWADCFSAFRWPSAVTVTPPWIHSMGIGVDGFLANGPVPELLTNTVGQMPQRMGQFVLSVILSHVHRLGEYASLQHRHKWEPRDHRAWPAAVLLLGTGAASQGVARALKAHGTTIVGMNRRGTPTEGFDEVVTWEQACGRAASFAVVVGVLPLTGATRRMVDQRLLSGLDGALLVNVGRGATIDETALRVALDGGTVEAAHLDVHVHEPLQPLSWMWDHPGVRITPHVAALTTPEEAALALLEAAWSIRAGREPQSKLVPADYT